MTKINLIIGIVAVILVCCLGYFTYDYGYTSAENEARETYMKQIAELQEKIEADKNKVSELEKQLAEASQKYELRSKELNSIKKENETWKQNYANLAKQKAFSKETVQRINEILER